jgi:hypothetical protein
MQLFLWFRITFEIAGDCRTRGQMLKAPDVCCTIGCCLVLKFGSAYLLSKCQLLSQGYIHMITEEGSHAAVSRPGCHPSRHVSYAPLLVLD